MALHTLSEHLAQELGLPQQVESARLRQSLGMHQLPKQLLRIFSRYQSDGLPAPVLPPRSAQTTSAYQLRFLELPEQDQQLAVKLQQTLAAPAKNWLSQLQTLQLTYPDVPLLFQLESVYYRRQENFEKARALSEAILERFPGYLFAACALASSYLRARQTEPIAAIFNQQLDLSAFEPGRAFEDNEISAFYGVMAWYHLLEMRILRAALCLNFAQTADPADPFLDNLTAWFLLLPEQVLLDLKKALSSA